MLPPRPAASWVRSGQVPLERAGEVLWEVPETVAAELIEGTWGECRLQICSAGRARHVCSRSSRLMPDRGPDRAAAQHARSGRPAAGLQAGGALARRHGRPADELRHRGGARARRRSRTPSRRLGRLAAVPDQTDQLFVVDQQQRLSGALPLKTMLLQRPRAPVAAIMESAPVWGFGVLDDAGGRRGLRALRAGLGAGGRRARPHPRPPAVDVMMDTIREEAEDDLLPVTG